MSKLISETQWTWRQWSNCLVIAEVNAGWSRWWLLFLYTSIQCPSYLYNQSPTMDMICLLHTHCMKTTIELIKNSEHNTSLPLFSYTYKQSLLPRRCLVLLFLTLMHCCCLITVEPKVQSIISILNKSCLHHLYMWHAHLNKALEYVLWKDINVLT